MKWRVKGVVQKVLGVVPAGEKIHYELQRRFGMLRAPIAELDVKIDDWRLMMGHLTASRIAVEESTFFEIGTGWYPAFPLLLYLAGAGMVHTVDLVPHLRHDLTRMAVRHLRERLPLVSRVIGGKFRGLAERHATLLSAIERGASIEEATRGAISYRAPSDATATGLADESVDVVFSNSVLEHIPSPTIMRCFTESMRILRPGGVVFHSVNCGDHYAYIDRTIDQLHYLQYSAEDWERWNNRFLYQNRLRAIDFIELATKAGFAIEIDTSRPHPDRLRQLAALAIHPQFSRYTPDQLAVTSVDFVARKQDTAIAVRARG